MTPMEAWRIISRNLNEYYRTRRIDHCKVVCSDNEIEAEVMCFQALKEMQERSEQK